MKESKFSFRGFISFSLFISFFIMTITGIILYLTPPGRVAHWIDWKLFGFTKEQWQAQHTLFSLLFLFLSLFHIFSMNWRTFLHYIKKKSAENFNMKKELLISVIVSLIIFFGTLFNIPPFKSIMDFGTYLTESWEKKEETAPMPHTEQLTLKELSEKIFEDITIDQIIEKLTNSGLKVVSAEKTLSEIGLENKKSPLELYNLISKNKKIKKDGSALLKAGSGVGRKTLLQISEISGLSVDKLIEKLKANGIDAKEDEKIKDIAEKADLAPIDLMKVILE